jgi:hypothetical protein
MPDRCRCYKGLYPVRKSFGQILILFLRVLLFGIETGIVSDNLGLNSCFMAQEGNETNVYRT